MDRRTTDRIDGRTRWREPAPCERHAPQRAAAPFFLTTVGVVFTAALILDANGKSLALKCNVARRDVKMLAAADASKVGLRPIKARVGDLAAPAPPHVGNKLPRQTGFNRVEFHTFRISHLPSDGRPRRLETLSRQQRCPPGRRRARSRAQDDDRRVSARHPRPAGLPSCGASRFRYSNGR